MKVMHGKHRFNEWGRACWEMQREVLLGSQGPDLYYVGFVCNDMKSGGLGTAMAGTITQASQSYMAHKACRCHAAASVFVRACSACVCKACARRVCVIVCHCVCCMLDLLSSHVWALLSRSGGTGQRRLAQSSALQLPLAKLFPQCKSWPLTVLLAKPSCLAQMSWHKYFVVYISVWTLARLGKDS